jgi:hypothetical protein
MYRLKPVPFKMLRQAATSRIGCAEHLPAGPIIAREQLAVGADEEQRGVAGWQRAGERLAAAKVGKGDGGLIGLGRQNDVE